MTAGRPTIYTEEILTKTREYILGCEDSIEEYHKTRGEKSDGYERIVKVKLPSIEGLAYHLGIHKDTIYEWRKEKVKFSELIEELLAKQARELINKGLSGDYNPTIAKVLLTKHGYREGTELTGKDGTNLIPDKQSIEKAEQAINSFFKNGGN